jgi:hypothetical protein
MQGSKEIKGDSIVICLDHGSLLKSSQEVHAAWDSLYEDDSQTSIALEISVNKNICLAGIHRTKQKKNTLILVLEGLSFNF